MQVWRTLGVSIVGLGAVALVTLRLGPPPGATAAGVLQSGTTLGGGLRNPQPITHRPGELVVKYRSESRPPAAALYRSRKSFSAYTRSAHLDALHQRYQVKDIQPLFTLPRQKASGQMYRAEASVAEWDAHLQELRQRFATRARRAAADRRLPDLGAIYKLTVPPETDIDQLAVDYAADPSVEYAEPNYTRTLHFTPNDHYFSSSGSWGQRFLDLWGLHSIHADGAWDLATGAGITVALIDTGCSGGREIEPNQWINPGEIPGNGIDDDGNGFVDDVNGWMFVDNVPVNSSPNGIDYLAHGTHVAGTIAATGNDGIGIIGVAWQAKVMTLGVFDALGGASSDTIAAALRYAVDNGADVVNMSYGGPGPSFLERDLIDFAAANGLVLVASAGNNADDVKATYPAALDPVIAVAAVDHLDRPSFFSNFGGKMEVAAPGGGDEPPPRYEPYASILSLAAPCPFQCFDPGTLVLPTYRRLGGTSMAAPHVTGTVALILSRHPEFTIEQVRQALRDGADDLGPPGRDARYGYGRLNAARAVALDAVAVARLHAPRHLSRVHGEVITVEATAQNPGGPAPSWRLLFGPQRQPLSEIAAGGGEASHAALANIDTGQLARGNYLVRLEVTTPNGAAASDTATFTRLATRPFMRQISDGSMPLGFGMMLRPNAWSNDAHTLVWTEQTGLGFQRIVARDLRADRDRTVSEFRFGPDPTFAHLWQNVEAALSGDGSTIAFSAPDDLSRSSPDTQHRNFQLFLFDLPTMQLTQASHQVGGNPSCGDLGLCSLSINTDGSRVAFASDFDLAPSVGNADGNVEVFYWERSSGTFRQLTNTAPPLGVTGSSGTTSVAMSAAGDRIVFVGYFGTNATQVYVYDVPTGQMRQLTDVTTPVNVASNLAITADGSQIAAWLQDFSSTGQQQVLTLIDAADGARRDVPIPDTTAVSASQPMAFSSDGRELVFSTLAPPDPLLPPPSGVPPRELFQYDLATGALRPLTALTSGNVAGLALAPDGRLALVAELAPVFSVDPEGGNQDGSQEVYILDPATDGGFFILKHGLMSPARAGRDRFSFSGLLVRPSGTLLDPATADVSLTIYGANGQLFSKTLPAGVMRAVRNGWRYSNTRASDLVALSFTTFDHVHYKLSAVVKSVGLAAAATPYLTVEVQNGAAIFSGSYLFRWRGRGLMYP